MSHFIMSLIVKAKSQDCIHKPPIFEKKGRSKRTRTDVRKPADQPALPLGQTDSRGGWEEEREDKYMHDPSKVN